MLTESMRTDLQMRRDLRVTRSGFLESSCHQVLRNKNQMFVSVVEAAIQSPSGADKLTMILEVRHGS